MQHITGTTLIYLSFLDRSSPSQGMLQECSDCTCMLVCAFLCANCTRDRGCSEHPVFPAPSDFEGQTKFMQTSGAMRREIANVIFSRRHPR